MKKALLTGLLLLVDVLLFLRWQRPAPSGTVLLVPLVPALTRVTEMGEHALLPASSPPASALHLLPALERLSKMGGRPEHAQALISMKGSAARIGELAREGVEARVRLESDTVEIAGVLGDERVRLFLERKEEIAGERGEIAVWRDLLSMLGGEPGAGDSP